MKYKDAYIVLLVLGVFIQLSCDDNITPPDNGPKYTSELKGKVFLENQTEQSNTLVYIDRLNKGVSTDSSGNYNFVFVEEDSVYNGEFKLTYFLNDYDMDSTKIILTNGKVKLDTLDVDNKGNIKNKELKQIVLIEGWTDKAEYRVGDRVYFNARITNVSNRMIHIFISSCVGTLSNFVSLYNDKYFPFYLGGEQNVYLTDCEVDIQPGGYYEGSINYEIIEYKLLIPDEYIVATNFMIEGRTLNHLESKFYKYIAEEWYKIDRGNSPKLDFFPNKYRFPHVKIVQ